MNERGIGITIAFDSSWQKRSYISKHCVVTATSRNICKVLYDEGLPCYCFGCRSTGNWWWV